MSEEKSSQALDSAQKDPAGAVALRKGVGLVATVASRVRRKRGTIVNKEDLVNVSELYLEWGYVDTFFSLFIMSFPYFFVCFLFSLFLSILVLNMTFILYYYYNSNHILYLT